jgi:arsenate reductase
MSVYKIFHNSKCSKSRQTLQLLKDNSCKIDIISYLEIDLEVSLMIDILKKLKLKPRDILRKGEQEYKDNNLKKDNLSDEDLINYMIKYPKLIERPIVVKGDKAVIGRPPEKVLELI